MRSDVGRTPEYLGKKIEIFEMKMASLVVLVPVLIALIGTAVAVVTAAGKAGASNPGPHGFSEILYAARRAEHTSGALTLLFVITPADFKHWMGVENIMRAEAMEEAETTLGRRSRYSK